MRVGDLVENKAGKIYRVMIDADLDLCLFDPWTETKEKVTPYNQDALRTLFTKYV